MIYEIQTPISPTQTLQIHGDQTLPIGTRVIVVTIGVSMDTGKEIKKVLVVDEEKFFRSPSYVLIQLDDGTLHEYPREFYNRSVAPKRRVSAS